MAKGGKTKKHDQGRRKIERKAEMENITDGDYIESVLCLDII